MRSAVRRNKKSHFRRNTRTTAATIKKASKAEFVRPKPRVVRQPQPTKQVVVNKSLHRLAGVSETPVRTQDANLQAGREVTPTLRKTKLRLHPKVRTTAAMGRPDKPVDLQTKRPVAPEPQPSKPVVVSKSPAAVERKSVAQTGSATSPDQRKKQLRLRQEAQRKKAPVGQTPKPTNLPAKPHVVPMSQPIETLVVNKRLDKKPVHNEPGEKEQASTLQAKSTVILGHRTIKILDLCRKARKTTIPVEQLKQPVNLPTKSRVVEDPQPEETVVINKRLDTTAGRNEQAEMESHLGLRARSIVAPSHRKEKLSLRRKGMKSAAPVEQVKQPADKKPTAQVVPHSQTDKAAVDQELEPIPSEAGAVPSDEVVENEQGASLRAAPTEDTVTQDPKVIVLDGPSADKAEPHTKAANPMAQDTAADATEAQEVQAATAPAPEGKADGIGERGLQPDIGVVANGEAGSSADLEPRRRKQVLVIDDDATMRKLLKMGLCSHQYDCLTAENGKIAQEVLQTCRPDLILVDLLMPVMDGLTFIQWLRQTAQDSTPVLVFTNVDTPKITQEAMEKGANAFACKPLHLKELLAVINQWVPD
jgi:CheY-like chemotaxis protein